MPKTSKTDFLAIFRTLAEHRVDFIVVGGVCAVLHGAPINTFDLDLVHSREPDNVERLLRALAALNAHYRVHPEREIKPDASHLLSEGHQLLITEFGPLDLLGTISGGREYRDLIENSEEMQVSTHLSVRVLNLETLIHVKEETGGEKDRAVLAVLRRTLEEKSRRQEG